MYAAYDALSDEEKAALDGLKVIHSWELSREKQGQKATPEEIRDAPPMSHPLVRVHPDTGRKCLFMGEHASHIEGRPMAEGQGAPGAARSARDRGAVHLPPPLAARRCADVGQSVPVAPRRPEFRRGALSARAAPHLSARHRAGVTRKMAFRRLSPGSAHRAILPALRWVALSARSSRRDFYKDRRCWHCAGAGLSWAARSGRHRP